MTIIKSYSANKELLIEDKPVDVSNVEQYIAQYGIEYAQGYMQALTDIEKGLEGILWKEIGSNYAVPNTAPRIHTALKIFYTHKTDLLKRLESLGVKLPTGVSPSNRMQD